MLALSYRKIFLVLILGWGPGAWAAELLRIGFIASFTGEDPHTARELKRGLELFLAAHPAFAKKYPVEVFDSEGDPTKAYQIVKQNAARMLAFVGIARSDEAAAAARAAEEEKTLFITPMATNNSVTEGKEFTFRICYADTLQAKALARFAAKKFPGKKILVLTNTESLYSSGLSTQFVANFPDKKLLHQDFYTKNDVALAVARVKELKPEVVFVPDHASRAAALAKTLVAALPAKELPKFLGGDGWGGKRLFHAIQQPTPELEFYYSTHWDDAWQGAANAKFMRDYRKLYPGESPTTGAALVLDAFALLSHALKASQDRKAKLTASFAREKLNGITGYISFVPPDNSPLKPVLMIRVVNGEYRVAESLRVR